MTPTEQRLADALRRLRSNTRLSLSEKPVRDWDETFAEVDNALATLDQPTDKWANAPAKWKMVPEGTTWDMRNAAREFMIDLGFAQHPNLDRLAHELWGQMIDATPKPPVAEEPNP